MEQTTEFNFDEKLADWILTNLTFWERNFQYTEDEMINMFIEHLQNKGGIR